MKASWRFISIYQVLSFQNGVIYDGEQRRRYEADQMMAKWFHCPPHGALSKDVDTMTEIGLALVPATGFD